MSKKAKDPRDLHIAYLESELKEQRRIVRELLDRLVARDAGALFMPGVQQVGPLEPPPEVITDQTGLVYGPASDGDDEDQDLHELNEALAEWDRVAQS